VPKIYKYSSIISIIVIISLLFNFASPALCQTETYGKLYMEDVEASRATGRIIIGTVLLIGIIWLLVKIFEPPPPPVLPPPPPPPTYKDERKFLRYETDEKTNTAFKISIKDTTLAEGKCLFLIHLDNVEHITTYKKEIWAKQTFKVYHDGKKELVSQEEMIGDITPLEEKRNFIPMSNAQLEVLTDTNLLKAGIVPRTDENGDAQIPLYSAKPFVEIEGTRTKHYGLTSKTQFLSEEKFRDYQTVPVEFRYKYTSVREEINCYSLQRSIKDWSDPLKLDKMT